MNELRVYMIPLKEWINAKGYELLIDDRVKIRTDKEVYITHFSNVIIESITDYIQKQFEQEKELSKRLEAEDVREEQKDNN